MKVGICGLGVVGNSVYSFMKKNKLINEVLVYDKYKNINKLNTLLVSDIIYICINTSYDDNIKTYNMDGIDETLFLLSEFKYEGVILIKSTVLPNYCENKNNIYPSLKIMHNPEFLSASTAVKDFEEQKHIILGHTIYSKQVIDFVEIFYKKLFTNARISITTSCVSALVKISCNSFYATKVQFFTELYLLCEKMNLDFNMVKNMMLNNEWIHPMHTNVPGQDGQISFGGSCLPKDISALSQYMYSNNIPNSVVNSVITERNILRND